MRVVLDASSAVNSLIPGVLREATLRQLLPQVWARRRSVRVSDACYVALAATLKVPLLTADRRLARAVPPGITVLTVA